MDSKQFAGESSKSRSHHVLNLASDVVKAKIQDKEVLATRLAPASSCRHRPRLSKTASDSMSYPLVPDSAVTTVKAKIQDKEGMLTYLAYDEYRSHHFSRHRRRRFQTQDVLSHLSRNLTLTIVKAKIQDRKESLTYLATTSTRRRS